MPTFDFKCPQGHVQEEYLSTRDEPQIMCRVCGQEMKKIFSPTRNRCIFDASDPEGTLWKDSKHKGDKNWIPYIP